jgi:hypothetical protein
MNRLDTKETRNGEPANKGRRQPSFLWQSIPLGNSQSAGFNQNNHSEDVERRSIIKGSFVPIFSSSKLTQVELREKAQVAERDPHCSLSKINIQARVGRRSPTRVPNFYYLGTSAGSQSFRGWPFLSTPLSHMAAFRKLQGSDEQLLTYFSTKLGKKGDIPNKHPLLFNSLGFFAVKYFHD